MDKGVSLHSTYLASTDPTANREALALGLQDVDGLGRVGFHNRVPLIYERPGISVLHNATEFPRPAGNNDK